MPRGWWLYRTWSASWRDPSVVLLEILSNVSFAMRTSFRKCGFRRLVGPVHERIHILQVAGSETGDESSRVLEIFNEDGDSNVVLLRSSTRG